MPAGQGNDEESFAAAVDRGLPPVSTGDVELELVARLTSMRTEYAPLPEERDRARAAAMARFAAVLGEPTGTVGPPLLAGSDTALLPDPVPADPGPEPAPPTDELGARRAQRGGRHAMPAEPGAPVRRRSPLGARVVTAAAAAVLATGVLGGAGVLASGSALPGDGLYPVKRVAESAGLAMTFDDSARARRHLELAGTRIDEVEQLLAEDPGTGTDPEVFRTALHDFDEQADQGSRLLLAAEDAPREQVLNDLQEWAAGQAERLAALRQTLPGPAAADAGGSLQRLEQLVGPGAFDLPVSCAAASPGTLGTEDCPVEPGAAGPGAPGAGTGTGPGELPQGSPTRAGQAPGAPAPSGRSGPPVGPPSGPPVAPRPAEPEPEPGLLPRVLPGDPLGGVLGGSDGSGDRSAPADGGSRDEPSGGLPPVEVPPLLPGLPGVSIG
ncbi:MAG TPA: DUF5667 domain-containing protein [Pseudonocardia sp.]|nr:DUF5667 domain-containing protein [Pseudonocardia sp.]